MTPQSAGINLQSPQNDSTPWTLTLTLGLMATSIYGNYMIEEEFDPWLFLDPYSYPAAFKANKDRYFPEKGENVLLFFRYRSYITSAKRVGGFDVFQHYIYSLLHVV